MLKKILSGLCLLTFSSVVLAAGSLKVGMSADYPPLHFQEKGKVHGVEVDNMRTVSEILSRNMKAVILPFDELIPALKAGKIDVIMSGLSVTAERSKEIQFSDAYLRVGQMSIMHKSKLGRYSQPWAIYREGVRVGVEPGTTGASFAARELGSAEVKFYDNPDAAFQGLRQDEIDLYVHDAPTSWQLANSMDNDDLISLYTPLTEEMLAWAVRKDDAALAAELNRALALMKSNGSLAYILNRWIPVTVEVQ